MKIFLNIHDKSILKCLKKNFNTFFSSNYDFKVNFIDNFLPQNFYKNIYNIVQYGWPKEAVPIVRQKRSIISRIFKLFFE